MNDMKDMIIKCLAWLPRGRQMNPYMSLHSDQSAHVYSPLCDICDSNIPWPPSFSPVLFSSSCSPSRCTVKVHNMNYETSSYYLPSHTRAHNLSIYLHMLVHADEKDSVLKGINSYRQTQNLPVLAQVDKASCLANEIADELEDVPCENVRQYYPSTSGAQKFPNFQKHVDKCGLNINSTSDGVILPACVAKLEPTVLLSNFTHNNRYASYLNDSLYTGVGLGSENDWMVLVLTTNTPTGSFSATASVLSPFHAFLLAFFSLLLMIMHAL